MMKKWGITIIVFLCCILSAVNIWADDGQGQSPDYVTDYYMIVQSPNGGINLYSETDPQSNVLNDKLIVNGTALHIQGEKTGTDQKDWGYTQYHGMNGYVPMDDLDPATREEAVNEEYTAFGGTDADFDVKIRTEDGKAPIYNGPGEKYEEVDGSDGIENSSSVHISQYVQGEDGIDWEKQMSVELKDGLTLTEIPIISWIPQTQKMFLMRKIQQMRKQQRIPKMLRPQSRLQL